MPTRKRQATHAGQEPELSTERFRRTLLARAYALILAPDWDTISRGWADLPWDNTGKNGKPETDDSSFGE